MFPILHLGPAAIQSSRLLMILGIFLGLTFCEHFARKRGENPDTITTFLLLAGAAGLVAARLAYAGAHFALFKQNLTSLVSLDPGLLDPWGCFAGVMIAALIYGQRKHMRFWNTLDSLTPFLAVVAVFVGLAHIASGQAYGLPTALPWAIELWGAKRHPSQIYETIGALTVFMLLWREYGSTGGSGRLFLKFVSLTSGLVVFLSAFRGDSRLILGSFRQDQAMALFFMGLALLLLEIKSGGGKVGQSGAPAGD